jgi:hypothetical protein
MQLGDLVDRVEEQTGEEVYVGRGGRLIGTCPRCQSPNCRENLGIVVDWRGEISLACSDGTGDCSQEKILDSLDLTKGDLWTGMTRQQVETFWLLRLARERCSFWSDKYRVGWAGVKDDEAGLSDRKYQIRSQDFKDFLTREFYQMEERDPTARIVTLVVRILSGEAQGRRSPMAEDESPHRLLYALDLWVDEHRGWTGAVSELLAGLVAKLGTCPPPGHDWPASPRGLGAMLRGLSAELTELGIEVKFRRRQPGVGRRIVEVRRVQTFTKFTERSQPQAIDSREES